MELKEVSNETQHPMKDRLVQEKEVMRLETGLGFRIKVIGQVEGLWGQGGVG